MESLEFCIIYLKKSKFNWNNTNQLFKSNHVIAQVYCCSKYGYTYQLHDTG